MSCNADKALQTVVSRQMRARQAEANAFLARRVAAWNRSQASGKSPPSLGSHLLGSVADIAIHETARALGQVVRLAKPQPTGEERTAGRERYLTNIFTGLVWQGVDVVKADEIVQQEACVLHLLDSLASGQLVAAAVEEM